MKKIVIYSMLALFIGAIFAIGLVSAYRGDPTVPGPYFDEDRHDAMEAAFANSDYDAWYALMTENDRHPRVVDVVTKDNFKTFVAAHEAMEDGDFETASTLRAELGLNNGHGPRDGSGMGNRMGQGKGQGTNADFSQRMNGQGKVRGTCR